MRKEKMQTQNITYTEKLQHTHRPIRTYKTICTEKCPNGKIPTLKNTQIDYRTLHN